MSEKAAADPVGTARRIKSLLDRAGIEDKAALRVEGEGGLAYASGLPVEDVQALLRGESLPQSAGGGTDSVEERHRRVVARIVFLRRTRLRTSPDGQRRAYSLADIAAGAGTSAQWLDKMLKTGKAPNLDHAAGIADFFGEGIEFLVAEPAEALDRVLQRIHKDLLERTVARQDADIERLRGTETAGGSGITGAEGGAGSPGSDLGIVGYAARALADVPDDTAQPIIALIETIARRSREERARESR
ncbi:hypothetical protein OG321_41985 [Streptomyces sp. NBC_00424]|uniref:hypothetical protein n=1 Tax=Streptomyces sp. NBC_00424 TaxID=2903648 RepID=UPI00224E5738|nr:hypothetical protein [Streptomyces sp. NBC_00424]MCX5078975.1 hypothetical protein [Streptomyces sp. NBC_00424]